MASPTPEEMRDTAQRLADKGWSVKSIARTIGVSKSTVHSWVAEHLREKQRRARQRFDRDEAAQLRRQGLTDLEIGAKLGVSGPAIALALGPRKEFFKTKKLTSREEREAALKRALDRAEKHEKEDGHPS